VGGGSVVETRGWEAARSRVWDQASRGVTPGSVRPWLAGPDDGPMGPTTYIYIYIHAYV
jgi:hypothetical protein